MSLEQINATLQRSGIAPFTEDYFTDVEEDSSLRKVKTERENCRVVDSCTADADSAESRVENLIAAFELVSPDGEEPSDDCISIFELVR